MDLSNLSIKNQADLKQILKFLDDQGFGYIGEWDLHQKKVDHIINKNNTFHITVDPKLKSTMKDLVDYDEIDKEVKNYFSKFNVDDKIFEFIKMFSLVEDDECATPWNNPEVKDIVTWVNFKKKYNLKDEFGSHNMVRFYNLDKNYLKINFGQYKSYGFKQFYKLIFGEECKEFDTDKKTGIWQNIGKIEIKFFLKGGANIKGDLTKIREYYYRDMTNKIYGHTIIKYNGKVDIIKSKNID